MTNAGGNNAGPSGLRDATPDDLLVTGRRDEFFDALEPGDVLLFQGADFLAGLAQLTERRTCYHSAIYLGAWPRGESGPTEHLMAHNVSTLWWRDLAAQVPGVEGSISAPLEAILSDGPERVDFFDRLGANLATQHLRDPFQLGEESLEDEARDLVTTGGVGVVTVDGYLDRTHTEVLYSKHKSAHRVHHVRSVVALRHHLIDARDEGRAAAQRASILAAVTTMAEAATAFNAAELLSVVPECLDRPGYREWQSLTDLAEHERNRKRIARLFGERVRRTQAVPSARELLRRRLRTIDPFAYFFPDIDTGPGWICASFVIATFAEAGMALAVDAIEDVQLSSPAGSVALSTPRDLWDCYDLEPIAMFVRGPERWAAGAAGVAPASSTGPAELADDDGSVVVFVDETGELAGTVLTVAPGVEVPVVAGPETPAEGEQYLRDTVAWRWVTPPGSTPEQPRRVLLAKRLKGGPRRERRRNRRAEGNKRRRRGD